MDAAFLEYRDSCTIYPTTVDAYGKDVPGQPAVVPCLYEQVTGYQHASSQDAIDGAPRLVLPPDNQFVTDHEYRLEEMLVEVNPFGAPSMSQQFKISSVAVARDVLLGNTVTHVECELRPVRMGSHVS